MYQRILVPLDGSSRAERALPVAARIARASQGSIILFQAVLPPTEYAGSLEGPVAWTIAGELDAEKEKATHYLTKLAGSNILEGVTTESVVVTGGAASAILSATQECDADLIVMSSHGYTGLTRWMLGSVAQKVIQYTSIPALVLRDEGPIPAGAHPDPEQPLRILIALDGSPLAEAVLEDAMEIIAALAAPSRGAVHLLRVISLPMTNGSWKGQAHLEGNVIEHEKQAAKKYLSTIAASIRASYGTRMDLMVSWSIALDIDVAHAIIRVAENGENVEGVGIFGGCDLIAMATHGRSGLQRWAMGSVTERVLTTTKLPLLVIRPSEKGFPHVPGKPSITLASIL